MIKVGLTGGIGSGKSTVAKVFEVLGIPVYYADLEAKRLKDAEHDHKIIASLRQALDESEEKLKTALGGVIELEVRDAQHLEMIRIAFVKLVMEK